GLTCPSPNPRSPGVSISHPSPGPSPGFPPGLSCSGGSGSASTEDDVCLPRPVTALTRPTVRSASGTSVFTIVDLPTPDWPISTLIRPASTERSLASAHAGNGLLVVSIGSPSGLYSARTLLGEDFGARSALVSRSSGSIPAS